MTSLIDLYLGTLRISIIEQFQYRVANYFYMIGMIAEPVIYLVQRGGNIPTVCHAERSEASRP